MYRFLLKPKWILFHLLVIALVVVMVNLAFWQLHRLQGRREFNDEVRSRSALATVPFEDVVTGSTEPADVEWRMVTVTGTYVADEQVVIVNRAQGGVAGVDVVTPLQITDGTLVLIDRGFVAASEPVPAPPSGTVTVTGRLRAPERRRLGGLTDPAEGDLTELHRVDVERIAAQLDEPVAPVFVSLAESAPTQGDSPVPLPEPELSEGPHLSYMVQWFIFSGCAVAGWVLAVRSSARKRAALAATAVTPPGEEPPVPPSGGTAR